MSVVSRPTQRGGSRRHERGAGCGGRGGALDGRGLQRTPKTCGPDTPTLVSSWRIDPRNDGGKKADHRGEHGISRKPLRAGMSGVFRWLAVNTRVHTYYHSAHEAAGASGARHSPRPLFSGRRFFSKPRAYRAARTRSHIWSCNVIARSAATKQSILSFCSMDCFAALAMTAQTFWGGCLKIESVVA